MVEHQDVLYVFGGELSFCNDQETPLWMFDIKENSWRKYQAPRGVATPKGRRGHTTVVHGDCLYIYGGYQVCSQEQSLEQVSNVSCQGSARLLLRVMGIPPSLRDLAPGVPGPGGGPGRVSGAAQASSLCCDPQ